MSPCLYVPVCVVLCVSAWALRVLGYVCASTTQRGERENWALRGLLDDRIKLVEVNE